MPAPDPAMTETYTLNGRSGSSVAEFTADRPGSYRVQAGSPAAGCAVPLTGSKGVHGDAPPVKTSHTRRAE